MIDNTLQRWYDIFEAKKPELLSDLLADDAVMISPVVHTPQKGKAITHKYLTAAHHVFGNDSFHYTREFTGEFSAVLEFETKIGDTLVNGVDMLEWNAEGLITEFKVMLRPLQAVNLIHRMMGEMLERAAKA